MVDSAFLEATPRSRHQILHAEYIKSAERCLAPLLKSITNRQNRRPWHLLKTPAEAKAEEKLRRRPTQGPKPLGGLVGLVTQKSSESSEPARILKFFRLTGMRTSHSSRKSARVLVFLGTKIGAVATTIQQSRQTMIGVRKESQTMD